MHTAAQLQALPLALLALLGGCASGSGFEQLTTQAVANEPARADAAPTEVYMRIASGAGACWFSPRGALARTHIFHADVDPPAIGGAAEIYVHERDRNGESPWGTKVFRVALAPVGEQTAIEVRNLKLPEALAMQMRADVYQWATGGKGCAAGEGGTGFNTGASPPDPSPAIKVTPRAKPKSAG